MKRAKKLQKALQLLKQANDELWDIIRENNLDPVSGDFSTKQAKELGHGLIHIVNDISDIKNNVTKLMK